MNIVSVNINQFLGKKSWTEKNINFQEETTKYMPKVIRYLKDNIKSENDIVILHEVPYKNRSNSQFYDVFKKFKTQLNETDLVLELPNNVTNNRQKPFIISCAIKLKKSNWRLEEQQHYVYSRCQKGTMYYNRVVELYNSQNNISLLGVHIPQVYREPAASVMWDDIIYYYKKLSYENVIIIGDMNVYLENTIQKRKFNELIYLGAIDAWTSKGNPFKKATFDDGEIGTRIDYALMSLTAFLLLKDIEIDDDPRISESDSYFTDHSSIKLLF